MVSNGLSHRRRTLKRPIVCKNDLAKNCGACTMIVSAPGQPYTPGATFVIKVQVSCDPDPVEAVYELTLEQGGQIFVVPVPIQINAEFEVPWTAPMSTGQFRVLLLAEQTTGCYWTGHVDYQVQ